MTKLLVICGPTATGKTKLASLLAKKFNGELISADSRMVYKHMDIGTGKDKNKYGLISGYDLVNPNEEFSVSHYINFAEKEIKRIIDQKKLPILVGGTGLYLKAITEGIETASIPQNKKLRKNLENKTPEELFEILQKTNRQKAISMNDSDKKNPRRLIRAIEVSDELPQEKVIKDYDILMIGLITSYEELKNRIDKRVDERIDLGFEKEINFLKENNFWNKVPLKTLGYKDWPDVKKWKIEEYKYSKRQMTWFKKNKQIIWFDIKRPDFQKEVEKLTQTWYARS
jgi:tRNA dimethylallyltransferase